MSRRRLDGPENRSCYAPALLLLAENAGGTAETSRCAVLPDGRHIAMPLAGSWSLSQKPDSSDTTPLEDLEFQGLFRTVLFFE